MSASPASLMLRYRRRLIRKRLILRAFRKRSELTLISDRLAEKKLGMILCACTLRNEMIRLPYYLDYYRKLGVGHFLMVDNNSDDGSTSFLARQPDVTLWHTGASYKASRFGVDWLNWIKRRHAHGHWTVIADADELLVYPDFDDASLQDLTESLERGGQRKMGAMMLDMYPKGPPDDQQIAQGQDPITCLSWFDAFGYWVQRQRKLGNLWLQGGVRARMFFADTPERAPTLNKIPLVKWHRSYAFVNSTHSALPAHLNDTEGAGRKTGVLLHTKFLPGTAARARLEKSRDEHFQAGTRYGDYYDHLAENPDLWCADSVQYEGWQQLVALGLMSDGKD